jgi:hypothetical protein
LSFGDAVKQVSSAQNLLEFIKNLSLQGTIITFVLTQGFVLCLLTSVYYRVLFKKPSVDRGQELKGLKSKTKQLGDKTIRTLRNVATLTIIFVASIGAVKFLVVVVSDNNQSTPIVAIAAWVIAAFYGATLVISLLGYGVDLVKMLWEL